MVEDWRAARRRGQAATMWAYSREATAELNARARALLQTAGELGDRQVVAPASLCSRRGERRCAPGDDVLCLHNRSRLPGDRSGRGVRNGAVAVVVDIECRGLDVCTADGRELRLPYDYVAEWVDHAYAMTAHRSQGRTLGEVDRGQADRRRGHAFVYGAASLGAEAALVAASRATDQTDL